MGVAWYLGSRFLQTEVEDEVPTELQRKRERLAFPSQSHKFMFLLAVVDVQHPVSALPTPALRCLTLRTPSQVTIKPSIYFRKRSLGCATTSSNRLDSFFVFEFLRLLCIFSPILFQKFSIRLRSEWNCLEAVITIRKCSFLASPLNAIRNFKSFVKED